MNRRKEILEELNDAAPNLAGIENQHPYRVPAGYFASLPELILLRIRTDKAESAGEELEILSPLLSGLDKKMPFSTPEGYFESLQPSVPGVPAEPARVVKMFQPRSSFRMAAAAVTVGIIALAGYLFFLRPAENQYAVNTDPEVQTELKTKVTELSENELVNFVESATILAPFENNSTGEINEDDIKLMLADISDQELQKFIDLNSAKEKFN